MTQWIKKETHGNICAEEKKVSQVWRELHKFQEHNRTEHKQLHASNRTPMGQLPQLHPHRLQFFEYFSATILQQSKRSIFFKRATKLTASLPLPSPEQDWPRNMRSGRSRIQKHLWFRKGETSVSEDFEQPTSSHNLLNCCVPLKDTECEHAERPPCMMNLHFVSVERWKDTFVDRASAWILKARQVKITSFFPCEMLLVWEQIQQKRVLAGMHEIGNSYRQYGSCSSLYTSLNTGPWGDRNCRKALNSCEVNLRQWWVGSSAHSKFVNWKQVHDDSSRFWSPQTKWNCD